MPTYKRIKSICKWFINNGLWDGAGWLWENKGKVISGLSGAGAVLGFILGFVRGLSPVGFVILCVSLGLGLGVLAFVILFFLTHKFVRRNEPVNPTQGSPQETKNQSAPENQQQAELYTRYAKLRLSFEGDNQIPNPVFMDNIWGYHAYAFDWQVFLPPEERSESYGIKASAFVVFMNFKVPILPDLVNFYPTTSCHPKPDIELKATKQRYAVVSIISRQGLIPQGIVEMEFRPNTHTAF